MIRVIFDKIGICIDGHQKLNPIFILNATNSILSLPVRNGKLLDKLMLVSSEVRGAPPSPLTYAKTAKIRGGGTPHAKISTSLSFGGQQLNDSLGKNQVLELQISKAARVLNSGLRK